MRNNDNKKLILFSMVVMIFFLFALPAAAAIINMDLDTEFEPGTSPAGTSPWLTATFEDGYATDTVILTLTTNNLVDNEKVKGWYFNFDSSLDVTSLNFTYDYYSSTGPSPWSINIYTGTDAFKADGDGWYDIKFEFSTYSHDWYNFSAGETIVYTITGDGISASSFEYFSEPGGGNGTYLSAAQVQGIGGDLSSWGGDLSAWIGAGGSAPVPEPATMVLFGVGLIGLAGIGRRQVKRQAQMTQG